MPYFISGSFPGAENGYYGGVEGRPPSLRNPMRELVVRVAKDDHSLLHAELPEAERRHKFAPHAPLTFEELSLHAGLPPELSHRQAVGRSEN